MVPCVDTASVISVLTGSGSSEAKLEGSCSLL